MVGTELNAALALAGNLTALSYEGTTRTVFIADDIVYKVNLEFGENDNRREWDNYLSVHKFGNLPDSVRVPDTHLYTIDGIDVIAMQYIKGQPIADCYCTSDEECDVSCMNREEYQLVSGFIDDTGGMNVIRTDEGICYLIDLA